MSRHFCQSLIAVLACAVLPAGLPAIASQWVSVAKDRNRTVEIDTASVLSAEAGTKVAWGRIVLSDREAASAGYKVVRALNRYDCGARNFVIVKRVYLGSQNQTLREETVPPRPPMNVRSGTVDERFFDQVCKPPTVNDLRAVAREAASKMAAVQAQQQPTIRHADIQLVKEEATPAAPAAATPAEPKRNPAAEIRAAAAARKIEMDADGTVRARAQPIKSAAAPAPQPVPVVAPAATPEPVVQRPVTPPPARPSVAYSAPRVVRPAQATPAPQPAKAHAPHWSYEGEGGPENWGKLQPDFSMCAKGQRQSPIDIREGIRVDQEPLQFDYRPSYFGVVDNGHTIQVNYGAGSMLTAMGRQYELQQFHFHHPSEERIDGRGFEMVVHLVHKDREGRLAVLAILLERGAEQPLIQTLWNNLPLEKNDEYQPRTPINVADLLPTRGEYFAYMGSLTTPPCSEGVLWLVMKQAVQLSADQIGVFARFYKNNARPVQPLAGRVIKESR